MKGNRGEKLSRKQEQAIAALITHDTIAAAAAAVRISEVTLWRWQQLPEFQARYREARRAVIERSISTLQQSTTAAVTTLVSLMNDVNVAANVRLYAATRVLDYALKGTEVLDLEQRLTELEEGLEPQHLRRAS